MSRLAAIGRADLLRAFVSSGGRGGVPVGLMGFQRTEAEWIVESPRKQEAESTVFDLESAHERAAEAEVAVNPIFPDFDPSERRLRFPTVVLKEQLQDEAPILQPEVEAISDEELAVPKSTPQPIPPLTPWPRLAPFLRRRLGVMLPGRRLDMKSVHRMATQGLPWKEVPRLARLNWAPHIALLWDVTLEMEPYLLDVAEVIRRLRREHGRMGLQVIRMADAHAPFSPLPPKAPALLLSAMGQMQGDEPTMEAWSRLGRSLARAGHFLTALMPCPRRLAKEQILGSWPCAVWDRRPRLPRSLAWRPCSAPPNASERAPAEVSKSAELLMDLLVPATIITPSLLRRMRLLLADRADVGTEHECWHHAESTKTPRYFNVLGAEYEARLERLRTYCPRDPTVAALFERASECIAETHQAFSLAIAMEAELRLGEACGPRRKVSLELFLRQALQRLRVLADDPGSPEGTECGLPEWFHRMATERLSPEIRSAEPFATLLAEGLALSRKFLARLDESWPAGTREIAALRELRRHARRQSPRAAEQYRVVQRVSDIHLESTTEAVSRGHSLGAIAAADWLNLSCPEAVRSGSSGQILSLKAGAPMSPVASADLEAWALESDRQCLHFQAVARPPWAERIWRDREGLAARFGGAVLPCVMRWRLGGDGAGTWEEANRPEWAERIWVDQYGAAGKFSIRGVEFILRWIPPGRFLMGSPEGEPGRDDDEGPQHEVRISRGFWLGATPVTQAQWQAVVEEMQRKAKASNRAGNENALAVFPSHFKGPKDLPVEQVSWGDCRAYCRVMSDLLKTGPAFSLPTEAQWEYACRAGTDSALYTGGISIRGSNDAPELEPIAWYGGNSGLQLEVKNAFDSRNWTEKSHPHETAGSHRVGLKLANPWGLFDMIGNVWEWCSDAKRRYDAGEQVDPIHDGDSRGARVFRGGSWSHAARNCRAAYRLGDVPGGRWSFRGFRLCASQEPVPAAPANMERSVGGERSDPWGGRTEGRNLAKREKKFWKF